MKSSQLIAYYGGTFDPIHQGHLGNCQGLFNELSLSKIYLLPNHIPAHRAQPIATSQQRLAMLKLAVCDDPRFAIDARELSRETYSYTIDTLIELRNEMPKSQPLVFIIGEDSLNTLDRWHRWQSLLEYAHLVVCPRKSTPELIYTQTSQLSAWIQKNQTYSVNDLTIHAAGKMYVAHTPYIEISATQLRQSLRAQDWNACTDKIPPQVLAYIKTHHLYE